MRQRFIQSFSTSGTEQEALYANELGKPYVCFIEDGLYIDWNTLSPVIPYEEQPLTFEILSAGTIEWTASSSLTKTIQYSLNGGDWTSITSTTAGTPINVVEGDKVQFRGYNSTYADQNRWNCFLGSAYFNAYGNIMSLIDGDNYAELTAFTSANAYAFHRLFSNTVEVYPTIVGSAANVIDASNLILPATTLAPFCYYGMFQDTTLEVAPVLPATTLTENCYRAMFCRAKKITSGPELPATTLAEKCYNNMFYECTSLTTAPELPATNLAAGCYSQMFYSCTSLTKAPSELPATTIPATPTTGSVYGCYFKMFQGCTSLTTAPDILAASFPNPGTSTYRGCCTNMFSGCTSLNYIKCLATGSPQVPPYATYNWVAGVPAGGIFVRKAGARWSSLGNDGIPAGWTVIDADI